MHVIASSAEYVKKDTKKTYSRGTITISTERMEQLWNRSPST